MGHYAKVEESLVVNVIVAEEEFINSLPDKDKWVETSYNIYGGVYYDNEQNKIHSDQSLINDSPGRKRKNYAGIGYIYDSQRDAFIPPKPFRSWIFNEITCLWDAPIPYPEDGKNYIWNELYKKWTLVE
jgi:hypothetical protein